MIVSPARTTHRQSYAARIALTLLVPNVLLLLESLESLGVGANRMKSVDPLAHVRS